MSSFRQQDIKDARVRAAIAKARSENGVHIYNDVPDTRKNLKFSTTLENLKATGSKDLTWTLLVRTAGDKLGGEFNLSNVATRTAMETDILTDEYVPYIKENGNWRSVADKDRRKLDWKRGQYLVVSMQFVYPQETTFGSVKFTLNGGEHIHELEFKEVQDFTTFGAKGHQLISRGIEVFEHHFLSTGITAGLPPRGSKGNYISFDKANLCFLSQGSTAVIVGQYLNNNSNYKGIMMGVATNAQSVPKDFASHNDTNEHVTFRVSVGFIDVAITTQREHKSLAITIGPQDDAWVILDNINILNIEIHTGMKNRNT